ncbi:Undecaprenol kinase [Pirellulimonas nuda]|uniref:Undecaprenol kinase n=1 Tax=Pirellulimonas nuda TaxID=2528009 RepID=A0A518D721_9BACT|nr:diacylglycerol kinase family protein [Pirellulimonas nuda]QDU87288.1 Undecaprenol kinase [Pirellulimonas nuda]
MRYWLTKFSHAFRGFGLAARQESSLQVHFAAAAAVAALAVWLQVSMVEAALLTISMTIVISAELMNAAIERLAKAVTREQNPYVRDALDVASGAVMAAVMGAVLVGAAVVFVRLA